MKSRYRHEAHGSARPRVGESFRVDVAASASFLRVRPAALAVCSVVVALVAPSAASGHVVPVPQFLASGSVATVSFAVPNERPEPMTGVIVTVPAGFRIVRAHPSPGWTETVDGSTATWQGGPLAHLTVETFRLEIDVSAPPGTAMLNTRELYPSGATVDWPATLTVVPGQDNAIRECRVGRDRRDRGRRADLHHWTRRSRVAAQDHSDADRLTALAARSRGEGGADVLPLRARAHSAPHRR